MTKYLALKDKITEFLLYNSPNGEVRIEVFLHNENVWLTQKRMAELFDVEVNTINYHLKEIFKSGELDKYSTIRKFRIVQKEGTRVIERETEFYNLDTIISVGYRVNSARATQFRIWATVQNKLHWAITGQTAAEIIYARANSRKNNMGLTTWKNAPKGKIRKTDITIAKNYLDKTELDLLNRIVSMYLDYAELQATNRKVMYMEDWILKLIDKN